MKVIATHRKHRCHSVKAFIWSSVPPGCSLPLASGHRMLSLLSFIHWLFTGCPQNYRTAHFCNATILGEVVSACKMGE